MSSGPGTSANAKPGSGISTSAIIIQSAKVLNETSLPRITKVSPGVNLSTEKTRNNNSAVKVEIHTPALYPDNPIHRFEANLTESVGLLRNYQHLLERNKKVEEELERGKQETISALVKQLVQRKQDHSVICKCVAIINRIKIEFEDTKIHMMKDARRQMLLNKVTAEDKEVQCDILKADVPTEQVIHTNTGDEQSSPSSDKAFLDEGESTEGTPDKGSNESQNSLFSYYPARKKSKAKHRVHFDPENSLESGPKNSNSNSPRLHPWLGQQKRVPLNTTSINIYQNVIPESSLKNHQGQHQVEPYKTDCSMTNTPTQLPMKLPGTSAKLNELNKSSVHDELVHEGSSRKLTLPNTATIAPIPVVPLSSTKNSLDLYPLLSERHYSHLANSFYPRQSSRPGKISRNPRSLKKTILDTPRQRLSILKTKQGTSIERSINGKPLIQTILNYTKIEDQQNSALKLKGD